MVAAALVEAAPDVVAALEAKLLEPSMSLPDKYRALFSLRNVAGPAATAALTAGAGAAWQRGQALVHTP